MPVRPPHHPVRVLVVEPRALLRYALSRLVQDHDGFDLVGVAADPNRIARGTSADVVLGPPLDHPRFADAPVIPITGTEAPQTVVSAIRRAGGGHRGAPAQSTGILTTREHQVLALVARGATDQQIADALYLSVRTVRSHLDRIRDKTGCRRRAELTQWHIISGNNDAE